MNSPSLTQTLLPLVARLADDILAEKLAAAVAHFNASSDPCERLELHNEIKRLRNLIGKP